LTDRQEQEKLAKQRDRAKQEENDRRDAELVSDLEDEESEMPSPPTIIRQMMAMFGVGPGGRAYHPVFDKFEPEHVDKFLDQSHEEDMERLRARRHGRWFALVYAVLVLIALGWLVTVLLPENKDLLAEFLKMGVAFAGGVGGGYGLKSYQETRRRE
jgi:hypothetical protein